MVKTVHFSKSSVLPPISITRYFDPGRAKTSDTVASPFSLANSLIFISLQCIEAASGSKAISSCSGALFDTSILKFLAFYEHFQGEKKKNKTSYICDNSRICDHVSNSQHQSDLYSSSSCIFLSLFHFHLFTHRREGKANLCNFSVITLQAASFINCFAAGLQMAGTVMTHRMSFSLYFSSPVLSRIISIARSLRYFNEWAKTTKASIFFPFRAVSFVFLSNVCN